MIIFILESRNSLKKMALFMKATGLTFITVKLFLIARVFIHTVGECETTKKNDFSSRHSFINLSLFYTCIELQT